MMASGTPSQKTGILDLAYGGIKNLIIGSLLCLTPITAIIVLGWLQRRMRFVAHKRAELDGERPSWVLGPRGFGIIVRLVGGLATNIREGVMAFFSLAIATAPFTVIWILSWWAGWENSFSKGYEQAFVGPALGLFGVAVFCLIMTWLPLALAHQAVENRTLALFEWHRVKSAVRHAGWGYPILAIATVVLALPLFAGRAFATFASELVPGFDDMTGDEFQNIANLLRLVLAVYVFVSLTILRGYAARIYATAVMRAGNGRDASLWEHSLIAKALPYGRRSWLASHTIHLMVMFFVWLGLAGLIFVGQFLNHDWFLWLTHPYFLLPWAG